MEQEEIRDKGTWRQDLAIMFLYQISLIFAAQLLFVIFLDYMPPTYCEYNSCHNLRSSCLKDYDDNEDLCPFKMGENRTSCVAKNSEVLFYSAQLQYQQDCTGWKSFNIATATFIGTLLGNIVLGLLADRYGRRCIYFLSLLFGIPCLVISTHEDVLVFYIFRILVGFTVAGTLTVGWTYASEMINPNRRLRLLAVANWPNARMIQVGLAYFTREWTRATYLTASISSLALPILWYLPESPIWLEQKDKGEEASRARKRILKIRGGVDEDLEPVQMIALERVNMLTILKSSRLRTSFLVILFMYFYGGMTIYITDLNGADMTQNLYLGQFLSGLVLSVAQFIIGMSEPFITGMGRRVLFLFSQIVAILCYIAIVVFLIYEMKGSYPYLVAYTLGYASQSICLESAYLALVELMPTDVRATVCSIANIAMKLGTIAATFTKPLKYADEPNLFMINMLLGVIGIGVVFFFLQESRSADLRLVGHIDSGPIFSADEEWEIEIVTDPDLEVVAEPKRSPPRTEEARSPKSLLVRSVVKSAEDSKEGSISKDPSAGRAKSEEQNSEAAKPKEPSSDGEKSKTPSPKKVNSNTPSPKKAKSRTPTPKKVKSRTPSSNGAKSKISRLKMARSKSPNAKKEISKEPSSHTAKLIERSTEETRTTEPTTEGTMTREQTTEGTITKENTTEVGKSTEPSVKKGRATDPSVKGAKSTEPTVEGGKSTEPSLEGGKSIEPSVKGGKPKQPSEEVAKPTEPSAEGSKPTEPSAEGAKSTEPSAEVAKPKEAEKKSAEGLKAAKSKSKEKSSGSKETPSAEPAKDRKSSKSNKVAVELESIKKNERAKPHTKFKHFKDDFRS